MSIPELIRSIEAGPGQIQEIISYVFSGDDPLELDAKSFSVESFLELYPRMGVYGSGLAFDVVIRTEGQPVTVELTNGEPIVCTNSLDKEVELEELLGVPGNACSVCENAETGQTESDTVAESRDPEQEKMQTQEQDMTAQELLDILAVAERVKCTTRHCDTSSGRRESVAEHSWRTALLAMLLSGVSEYKDYDMDRVIRMCLIHDLGEAFTGDIPTFEKTAADEDKEVSALMDWVGGFPEAQRREFSALFSEMEKLETREARLYKAIDKIEAVIQHNESDIRTWLPLEYDLQLTYGQKEAAFSPWLSALRGQVDQWTREKIESAQNSL
jgi:putative hydrolase of HD superfamily